MKWISKDELNALMDLHKIYEKLGDRVSFLPPIEKEEDESMKGVCKIVKITCVVVAVLAVIGAAAYGIYKFINKDYDDDFDDDFDDFDDDFYDDIDELDELGE